MTLASYATLAGLGPTLTTGEAAAAHAIRQEREDAGPQHRGSAEDAEHRAGHEHFEHQEHQAHQEEQKDRGHDGSFSTLSPKSVHPTTTTRAPAAAEPSSSWA